MATRGRHQTTSKECRALIRRIQALKGVSGVIIGRSYGGKSLGSGLRTGSIRVQRRTSGGIKAVMQSSKGLQELFIRTLDGEMDRILDQIASW